MSSIPKRTYADNTSKSIHYTLSNAKTNEKVESFTNARRTKDKHHYMLSINPENGDFTLALLIIPLTEISTVSRKMVLIEKFEAVKDPRAAAFIDYNQ